MIRVRITDEQRRELEQVSRQAIGRVALRAQMVLLAARGYSAPRIADIHACGPEVVRQWLHRYREEGVRAMWMKGPRVRVPTPGKNQQHAFFGALDAVTGRWFWADHARKLAVHAVAFLDQIAAAYPTG